MFDTVYKLTLEATDIDDLKRKLGYLDVNARKISNPYITAATQLAMDGNVDRAEWLRELGASNDSIAFGYAHAGNDEQVAIYFTEYCVNAYCIAMGYAMGGHIKQVAIYHAKYSLDANCIAIGYALGGHHEQVEACIRENKIDINQLACAYARVGNIEKTEAFRLQYAEVNVDDIVGIYIDSKNHAGLKKYSINCLLDSYISEREAVRDSSGNTKEYFYGSFFSSFQKSFTEKCNAVQCLQSALAGGDVDLSKHLSTLRNGQLGKELRAFIKSGMANDLVGKPVNTVSDFVAALQEKNSPKPQEYQFI